MAENTTTATQGTPVPAPTPKPAKPEGQVGRYQEKFATAEAALAEANSRQKGPNRAFTAKLNGKEVYVVAGNWDRAAGIAFMEAGGTVYEIGKHEKAKSIKPVGVEGILQAIQGLPENERAAVEAQLKALVAKKAEPVKK